MLTCIENRIKKLILIAIGILPSTFIVNAQPLNLEPELDINSGLSSNSVRVIKKDEQKRTWLGTDAGLVILNHNEPFLNTIVDSIKDNSVWALAFHNNHVLVGTRFKGLYIFDLKNKQFVRHIDSSEIGLCRRFRVFNDTVFIATKKQPYFLVKNNNNWRLTKIKTNIVNGFFTDFAMYNGRVYVSFYSSYDLPGENKIPIPLYLFQKDSLLPNDIYKPEGYNFNLNTLSLRSHENEFVIGGDGFVLNKFPNKSDTKNPYIIFNKNIDRYYPVWDIDFAEGRTFLITGNPSNTRDGMIYEPGVSQIENINSAFYGQSLFYDSEQKGMWAGTFNRGLFYWPNIATSYAVPYDIKNEYRFKPINKELGILQNDTEILIGDVRKNNFIKVFSNSQIPEKKVIFQTIYWKDTLAVLFNSKLVLVSKNRVIKSYKNSVFDANYIYKKNGFLFIFSNYFDQVSKINLASGEVVNISSTCNQIIPTSYNGNLFYASYYTGFHYFDSVSHAFNIPFPFVESYTTQKDTLWVLNSGVLSSYKILLNDFKLIPLTHTSMSTLVEGMLPSWVIQCKGKVYCGNNKGFLLINPITGNPEAYKYLGNFKDVHTPISDESSLYFNYGNYITRIDPDSVFYDTSLKTINIIPEKTIYENTPLTISFNTDNYITQQHSLKRIEIFRNSKLVSTLYTLSDHSYFPIGLDNGSYVMDIYINGVKSSTKKFHIYTPLTSNPLFYTAILIAFIIISLLLFKNILNKRSYDKHILENRLQLLKQNLNPHFIFNSLNLIYSLVLQKKNDTAVKTINHFSDLHRYYLENINKPTVSLKQELMFIESYLKLESERFHLDNPFTFFLDHNLNDQIGSLRVPAMILQPLVENAIKYCGINTENDVRSIWIDLTSIDNHLIIGVENTLGSSKIIGGTGFGLKLVEERLQIFNKTFRTNISIDLKKNMKHCENGYRCELSLKHT